MDPSSGWQAVENNLRQPIVVDKFPSNRADAPINDYDGRDHAECSHYGRAVNENHHGTYASFTSCLDWEIAQWAKLRGPGSTAISELLSIDGVCV